MDYLRNPGKALRSEAYSLTDLNSGTISIWEQRMILWFYLAHVLPLWKKVYPVSFRDCDLSLIGAFGDSKALHSRMVE